MKKYLLLSLSVLLCLLLVACGESEGIYGEVVEVTSDALIVETDGNERVAVLLDGDTLFSSMVDAIDANEYKAAPHTDVQIWFYHKGRDGSITAADGTKVKAYRPYTFIDIEAYLSTGAATLSDGTVLDAWIRGLFGTTYQTEDGVELLRNPTPAGPENYSVGNLEIFDDLSETAKPKVSAFYDEMGPLYDLQAELERAWSAYKNDPENFSSFLVQQDTVPSASGENIFYFTTVLTKTIHGNVVQESYFCNAFDRETGEHIPLAEQFTCSEEELITQLLDLAEKAGSGPADPTLKEEMVEAFRMEYLTVQQDGLQVAFPQGMLSGPDGNYIVTLVFNEECKALLQPWALPTAVSEDF